MVTILKTNTRRPFQCAVVFHRVGPLLLFLFMIDLPDGLEAPKLLFTHDVKMVTLPTMNLKIHSSLNTAWFWSKKWDIPINPANCNFRSVGKTFPVKGHFGYFFEVVFSPSRAKRPKRAPLQGIPRCDPQAFSVRVVKYWNELPASVVTASSINVFKTRFWKFG